ncbi:NADH-quinone oxidoreductase subunit E [Loktanella ponticola]|uniref:NADH-quinone oxidoreductase subunit E n=1 Tax=Yoonia ponticola TaxID=1524255 RepID=A0A7W9BKE8_9RHOB|nr:NADH-quinone oxidoreductase subunit NuoE [Yoonia ponticola]MBB5722172.1 NADH-quinone oxidoreductase subunit E [Yoonia ponticola]
MLRRLHHEQPDSFAFTPENQKWAEAQTTKYPEGRQASAIIPILWRAQEQEGWLTRPAIEYVAEMLGLAYIRALEVASFYFMFQLQPVGTVAHIQVCGTLSCMICGAEDLIGVCKDKIADKAHALSADGRFSWEEVECLGSCANAPMAQIGKDYYEDLTAERLSEIIDEMAAGKVPTPGPQNGRYAAEPLAGLTSLTDHDSGKTQYNASVQLATDLGDTIKRIDGTEVPILTPWLDGEVKMKPAEKKKPAPKKTAEQEAIDAKKTPAARAAAIRSAEDTGPTPKSNDEDRPARPETADAADADVPVSKTAANRKAEPEEKPATTPAQTDSATKDKVKPAAAPVAADGPEKQPDVLTAARASGADDLKRISGVGPKLEGVLNDLGFYHFDQIAKWTAEEIQWVDNRLKFKGRIVRDDWVSQAKAFSQE